MGDEEPFELIDCVVSSGLSCCYPDVGLPPFRQQCTGLESEAESIEITVALTSACRGSTQDCCSVEQLAVDGDFVGDLEFVTGVRPLHDLADCSSVVVSPEHSARWVVDRSDDVIGCRVSSR